MKFQSLKAPNPRYNDISTPKSREAKDNQCTFSPGDLLYPPPKPKCIFVPPSQAQFLDHNNPL